MVSKRLEYFHLVHYVPRTLFNLTVKNIDWPTGRSTRSTDELISEINFFQSFIKGHSPDGVLKDWDLSPDLPFFAQSCYCFMILFWKFLLFKVRFNAVWLNPDKRKRLCQHVIFLKLCKDCIHTDVVT